VADTGLIDQWGKPIPRARLQSEIAAPDYVSARPPFAGHYAYGMTPQRLASILRAADNGSTLDYFILAQEIEELFPHYYSVLSKRRRQVSLLPVTVEAAEGVKDGEKHADFVREWLATGVLDAAMFDITDAIGKGYSVCEIMWDTLPGRVWPREIIYRPQRFFEVSWEDGSTIWLRTDTGFEPLVPHKFLLHQHKSKSGGAARSGLTRAVAFLWMYANYTARDWAQFTQNYGLPVRVGTYGPEASETDKRTLWRAVSSIGGDLAAIIPKSMEMTFVEPKGKEGHALFKDRSDWLNYEVSKLVMGSTAGTDAVAGGHAVGQEHREAEQDVELFDARLLQTSVDRQIVRAMIAFTFGPQTAYPALSIGRPAEVPMSDVIAAAADLGPLGLKLKATEIRDRLQMTAPEGDDEVIGPPPPPPPGAGGAAGALSSSPEAAAALKIKANPHPEINPDSDTRALHAVQGALLGRFIALHAQGATEMPGVFDALQAEISAEATIALDGMTEQLRAVMTQATDLPDLADKLGALKLSDDAFANAIARGMALSHLAGQSAILDELSPGKGA
jgi:phage gp29-like protein